MKSNTWIALLAYEARIRHTANCRREEGTARRLASVRARVIADLRCAIAADIEGFLDRDQSGFGLTCRNGSSAQGFVVLRTHAHLATRMLTVDLELGTLTCRYETSGGCVGEIPDQWVLAIGIGNDGAVLRLRDGALDRTFATVDVLSAFLLAPVLTDR